MDRGEPFASIDATRNPMGVLGVSIGAITGDMGTFRIVVELENPAHPGPRRSVSGVLVDTGSELSWFPADLLESLHIERYERWRFRQASVVVIERWVADTPPAGARRTMWCSVNG